MNGHDSPEQFDPIGEFNLRDDPAYLEFNAKLAGDYDGQRRIPFDEGIARLGDVSADEYYAYIRAYHDAALRKAVRDTGIDWRDCEEVLL